MPSLRPNPIRIDDPADPRIAGYRAVRERDLVGREGQFVAEGRVVLEVLLGPRSRFAADSMLVTDRTISVVEPLRPACPVYIASQPVMDAIVGFRIHRGLLALGIRGPDLGPEALLPSFDRPALVVCASRLANHDNVGALLRNAAAFGADAVLFDDACCDPLYRKAIRVSVGHALAVPWSRGGALPTLIETLRRAEIEVVGLSPGGSAVLGEARWPRRVALLLGPEGAGLPAEVMKRVRTARIDMAPHVDSLNVATAAAIALHAIRTGGPQPSRD